MAIADSIRLDWFERQFGLHWEVEILYVPGGIVLTLCYDGNPRAEPVQGKDMREAMDLAREAWKGLEKNV